MGNLFTQISFGNFLHLDKNHGRDFFGRKDLITLAGFYLDMWLGLFFDNLEWEIFKIVLDSGVTPFSSY